MSIEGKGEEKELLVGTLFDHGRVGYTYVSSEHMVQARNVEDRFAVRNNDDGTPDVLTVVRFEEEVGAAVPRGCSVPHPVRVAPGESLRGVYIGGEVNDQYLSVSIRPEERDLAANVACTLTRVK